MDQAWKEQNQQIIWVWIQLFQLTVEKYQTIMAFIDQKTRLADNAKYMKFIFEYLNYRETLCVCGKSIFIANEKNEQQQLLQYMKW